MWLQKSVSIQPRTSPLKIDHFVVKSEKGSISNISTKVRLGSAEDGDIDTPLWEGMIPPNPHGHFGADSDEEDSDESDESEEDDMDVPIDLGLPPMMVVAEEPPAAVPAVVRRDDVEVHDL